MSVVVTRHHCKKTVHKIKACKLLTKRSDLVKSGKLENGRKHGVSAIITEMVTSTRSIISKKVGFG